MNPTRTLAATFALGLCLTAGPALADDPPSAPELFTRGLAAFMVAKYDEACPALEESYKLDPAPLAVFFLAEAKRGRTAAARQRYDEYLALCAALPPEQQEAQREREAIARHHRSLLTSAELTVVLPSRARKDTRVTVDGELNPAPGKPELVKPGEHVVTTQAPGGPVSEARITLAAGDTRSLVLQVPEEGAPEPAAPLLPPAAPPAAAPQGKNVVIYLGAGLAGAAAVAGAAFLGVSKFNADKAGGLYTRSRAAGGCPPASSPNLQGDCAALKAAYASEYSFSVAGTGSLIAAGITGAGTLVYGLLRGSKAATSSTTVHLMPSVTAHGSGLWITGAW
jgi:hypothetical protein